MFSNRFYIVIYEKLKQRLYVCFAEDFNHSGQAQDQRLVAFLITKRRYYENN